MRAWTLATVLRRTTADPTFPDPSPAFCAPQASLVCFSLLASLLRTPVAQAACAFSTATVSHRFAILLAHPLLVFILIEATRKQGCFGLKRSAGRGDLRLHRLALALKLQTFARHL